MAPENVAFAEGSEILSLAAESARHGRSHIFGDGFDRLGHACHRSCLEDSKTFSYWDDHGFSNSLVFCGYADRVHDDRLCADLDHSTVSVTLSGASAVRDDLTYLPCLNDREAIQL